MWSMCLERWALAKRAFGQEWRKPFLLQISLEGGEPEPILTFRTLGGNIAASIKWNSTDPTTSLPEAVQWIIADRPWKVLPFIAGQATSGPSLT